jgi:hypothetical protein
MTMAQELENLAKQLLDAAHYCTQLEKLEDHCREIARKLQAMAYGQPQSPSTTTEAITMLEAFVANAEKAGDTNSGDRWYRGNAQAWRQAGKLIRPIISALSDTRPDRNRGEA